MTLALPFMVLRLTLKGLRTKAYKERMLERLGIYNKYQSTDKSIWVHAVSLGESIASFPIIKELQKKFPDYKIVITSTTPTGSNIIRKTFKDSVINVYNPFDVSFAIHRFIKKFNPKKLILIETELWPNFIYISKKNNLNIYLINARLSDKSANGYARISSFSKLMIDGIDHISAQYEHDACNFIRLGADKNKVSIDGNVKFDIIVNKKLDNTIKDNINKRLVICAASTHSGEEDMVIEAFTQLLSTYPDLLLILVPRHPERFNEVASLIKKCGLSLARRSLKQIPTADTQVFLGDTMGELLSFYNASNIAFVGGSLVPVGGHNLLEPASLGVPVVSGKYLHNFKAISKAMISSQSLMVVDSQSQLRDKLKILIDDTELRNNMINSANNFLNKNKGAIFKIIKHIN